MDEKASRYAVVTLAILMPDGVETEDDVREYLRLAFALSGVEWTSLADLPDEGDRLH